jgi:hypothetical protein
VTSRGTLTVLAALAGAVIVALLLAADGDEPESGLRAADYDQLVSLAKRDPAEAMNAAVRTEVASGREPEVALVLAATALANRFAPYGTSVTLSWPALKRQQRLDCDNYSAIASVLYRAGGGTKAIRHLGFDNGPIGNHAQLQIGRLIADPTTGLVAEAPGLLLGRPARRIYRRGRFRYPDQTFARRVEGALTRGLYRSKQVIYDFDSRSRDLAVIRRQTGLITARVAASR